MDDDEFTMFIGERDPDVSVGQSEKGVSISAGAEWFDLTVSEAVQLAQGILHHALRSDRAETWKAALDL